ncbi:fluoride efflux transporter CrcB [bacterium]|nr:fluoride efflux transporter CrcB [bacterium]
MNYLIIFIGGGIGAMSRYALQGIVYEFTGAAFPYGTLMVNVLGCFLIGVFAGASEKFIIDPQWRIFLTIGLLGGFTTFSSLGYETFALFRDGEILLALANIFGSVLIGLLSVWLGFFLIK